MSSSPRLASMYQPSNFTMPDLTAGTAESARERRKRRSRRFRSSGAVALSRGYFDDPIGALDVEALEMERFRSLMLPHDPSMMHEQQHSSDVLLGCHGVDDWLASSRLRAAVEAGVTTVHLEGTWVVPPGWSLLAWAKSLDCRFNFTSARRLFALPAWGTIEATLSRDKLEVEAAGTLAEAEAMIAALDAALPRAANLVEWVYSPDGHSISVPLSYRPAPAHAYPWLGEPLGSFVDRYLASDASVLILIGPPGTGKTTFVKNLIHRAGTNAKVTYDERVMANDSLFANFVEGNEQFLVMEDADAFLSARTDGNTVMHKFLNVADGLISAKGKKLIFSTNVPKISDIDEALMRPGRCFGVLEFRALTREEAAPLAAELGVELPDGAKHTLAELIGQDDGTVAPRGPARVMGFR
jgi:hypothetical protein